jgi:hypothetical protein
MSKCIEWTGTIDKTNGYGVKWCKERNNWKGAHRWTYEQHYGPIPKGLVVRHLCHNKTCVNPEHLAIGTHADNSQDDVDADRQLKGTQIATSKLTEQQVLAIRADTRSSGKIAKDYGIHKTSVLNIKKRVYWKHI